MKLLVKDEKYAGPVLQFSLVQEGRELDLMVEDTNGNENCLLSIVELEGELFIRRYSLGLGFESLFRTNDQRRPEVIN